MNIAVTTQNAADALDISRTARDDRKTYWIALANSASHAVQLINRLGATEATSELDMRMRDYLAKAEAARERGDVEADAYNRGKFAGYHMALTD
jgi:hypothetical protein